MLGEFLVIDVSLAHLAGFVFAVGDVNFAHPTTTPSATHGDSPPSEGLHATQDVFVLGTQVAFARIFYTDQIFRHVSSGVLAAFWLSICFRHSIFFSRFCIIVANTPIAQAGLEHFHAGDASRGSKAGCVI